MKMMERLPTLLVAVLCFGILAVCDIKEAEANNNSVANAILGGWETSSGGVDYLFDRATRRSYGGGSTTRAYFFHKDGTFQNAVVTTGYGPGTKAGWFIIKGKYKISGNQIILFNASASWTDTNYPSESYKDEPTRDETLRFELVRDENTNETKLKIQRSADSYDTFWRQKNQPPPTAQEKQSDQPSYVKARHQFKRITPISKSVDEHLNDMHNLNEAEKAEMKAWLNPMMDMIQAEVKKNGHQENVSVAIAFAFCFAYEIFYAEGLGNKFNDERFELIVKSLDQVVGKNPAFDKMTDAQKQKFVDAILISSALLLKGYKDVSKLQDLKAIEEVKDAMRQLTQTFGMDEKNLKPSLEKMANLN